LQFAKSDKSRSIYSDLDRSRLRRDRYNPVKKNAERFARIDLDLSDFEKERTQCVMCD